MERRLSAILAADIVGYSAQMERDEEGTFARLVARRREIFEPEIARHQGRIFKLMGDGILAEFGSVVQAVECAMAIQTALAERNRAVPVDQAIEARIGINLGEVIVDGDDRYGEGVNIAARLEPLAEPGGICVSEKVAREVERKLAFGFEPMGAQRVKNMAEPVVAYRVTRAAGGGGPLSARRWRSFRVPAFVVPGASMLAAAGVAVVVTLPWQSADEPPTVPAAATAQYLFLDGANVVRVVSDGTLGPNARELFGKLAEESSFAAFTVNVAADVGATIRLMGSLEAAVRFSLASCQQRSLGMGGTCALHAVVVPGDYPAGTPYVTALTPKASRDFQTYVLDANGAARGWGAFAYSGFGEWGWSYGIESRDAAIRIATLQCESAVATALSNTAAPAQALARKDPALTGCFIIDARQK